MYGVQKKHILVNKIQIAKKNIKKDHCIVARLHYALMISNGKTKDDRQYYVILAIRNLCPPQYGEITPVNVWFSNRRFKRCEFNCKCKIASIYL